MDKKLEGLVKDLTGDIERLLKKGTGVPYLWDKTSNPNDESIMMTFAPTKPSLKKALGYFGIVCELQPDGTFDITMSFVDGKGHEVEHTSEHGVEPMRLSTVGFTVLELAKKVKPMLMAPKKASLVDQFIAAKVKARYAATKKADVNDYPEILRSLKSADAEIAGIITLSKKYETMAKKGLDDFEKAMDGLPGTLEKLGVSTKSLQRYFTQISNLIKVAKKGHPLRAYSTFKSETPIAKAQKVLMTLGQAALKAGGIGTAIVKPVLITHTFQQDVVPSLQALKEACDDWYKAASDASSAIDKNVTKGWVSAEPHRTGFGADPEFDKYAEAQREFAKQSKDLTDLVRHYALGLPLASTSFEDCVDVDICLKTMAKGNDDLIKLHMDFGKKWGDFRAKHQDKYKGQPSLF